MRRTNGRRGVAVIAGCRTPFCKAGTQLKDVRGVDLARYAARELVERTNLDGRVVDEIVFGQVVPSPLVPNVAREVSLLPSFPKRSPPTRSTAPAPPPARPSPRPTTRSPSDTPTL